MFEAAARSGSFSRAADELHVTQSAVSHQIRQLEDWFGVPLFDRQGRRTVPTQDGADLAHALADAFATMTAACKRLSQRDTGQALTIGVLPSIATIWLIPRLTDFLRDNPDIAPRVQYAFHGRRLDFGDIDIAIQWGIPPQGLDRITKLLSGSTIAVCSEAFLARHGPIERPRDISERPLLHDTDRSGWQNWLKASGVKAPGPLPGPVFEDFNLLRAAALSGQGVALCPASLIADDLAGPAAGAPVRHHDPRRPRLLSGGARKPGEPSPRRGGGQIQVLASRRSEGVIPRLGRWPCRCRPWPLHRRRLEERRRC
ncbi:MAG: LysR family transcriptional regulator [Rhizobiales bacterium]|nr:LysR family transcriptional regulator [Hyphomicrobiales bacterium]